MRYLDSVVNAFRRPTEQVTAIIPTGRPQYACSHPIPTSTLHNWRLPVELWWDILQFAVEPSFATDQTFLPQDIQFYFSALIIHHFSNPGNTHVKRTKAALRLVCRDFKLIVDKSINVYNKAPLWLSPYSPDVAAQYGPAARIDVRVDLLSDLSSVTTPYKHEVKVLTIKARRWCLTNSQTPSLSFLLGRPWALTVLHISLLETRELEENFSAEIISGLPLLHTLSIAAYRAAKVSCYMSMSQIRTLFLCFECTESSDFSEWFFPNLLNLTIDERGWPQSRRLKGLSIGFVDLLSRHKDTIRSLRLFPCQGFDSSRQSIPTILKSMPHLEALATDFAEYAPLTYHPSILDQVIELWPSNTAFQNLRHIIQVSTRSYESHLMSSILLESLRVASNLKTLAITDEPFLPAAVDYASSFNKTNEECMASLRDLDKICRSRGIEVIGEMGMKLCCVFKAWKSLSSIQMSPDMASFFGRQCL